MNKRLFENLTKLLTVQSYQTTKRNISRRYIILVALVWLNCTFYIFWCRVRSQGVLFNFAEYKYSWMRKLTLLLIKHSGQECMYSICYHTIFSIITTPVIDKLKLWGGGGGNIITSLVYFVSRELWLQRCEYFNNSVFVSEGRFILWWFKTLNCFCFLKI